jgi:hypothetical protein
MWDNASVLVVGQSAKNKVGVLLAELGVPGAQLARDVWWDKESAADAPCGLWIQLGATETARAFEAAKDVRAVKGCCQSFTHSATENPPLVVVIIVSEHKEFLISVVHSKVALGISPKACRAVLKVLESGVGEAAEIAGKRNWAVTDDENLVLLADLGPEC